MKEEVEGREDILVGRKRRKRKLFTHLFKFNKYFSSDYYASGTLRTFHILKDLILATACEVATSTTPVL